MSSYSDKNYCIVTNGSHPLRQALFPEIMKKMLSVPQFMYQYFDVLKEIYKKTNFEFQPQNLFDLCECILILHPFIHSIHPFIHSIHPFHSFIHLFHSSIPFIHLSIPFIHLSIPFIHLSIPFIHLSICIVLFLDSILRSWS